MKTLFALALVVVGCNKDTENSNAKHGPHIDIAVTENGFEPADLPIPAGKPVTLVFERTTDKTCAKEVVILLPDGTKIEKQLPLNTPVEVATTFPTGGKVTYACGMNMLTATLTVQ